MSYRIKIYIQYHYVYYIYTLCLYLIYLHLIYSHLIYSHLIYSHLIYSHLIYSHLIYSHLIYSHLIYSHLIYLPFKFTSIIFQKIRRCAPHIETYQRPPTLTLGSTFHIQYRHIPITASRLFHSQQPLQAVLLHRLNLSFPAPSHTDTSQQNSRPPQPSTPKKSPRGVQRGRGFAAPLRFSFFPQKNTACHSPKKQTPHSI